MDQFSAVSYDFFNTFLKFISTSKNMHWLCQIWISLLLLFVQFSLYLFCLAVVWADCNTEGVYVCRYCYYYYYYWSRSLFSVRIIFCVQDVMVGCTRHPTPLHSGWFHSCFILFLCFCSYLSFVYLFLFIFSFFYLWFD